MTNVEESKFHKETMIRVDKSTAEMLRDLGKKGDSYNDVIIEQFLAKAKVNVPISPELNEFVRQISHAMSEPAQVVDVGSVLGETVAKVGAVSGFRGESFRDWGVQETAKATMITFFKIPDRYTLLSTMMTQSMSTLIDEFGATELEPVLEQTLEAIATAFARRLEGEG